MAEGFDLKNLGGALETIQKELLAVREENRRLRQDLLERNYRFSE